jgi:membrane protein YdbS with pleckstrin-like domain
MDNLIIKKINLKPGEEVVRVVRHYALILWPKILAVFLLLTLPFFFLFPLFKFGYWGVAIFLFLILLGLVYGLRILVVWYYNVFIITNQRIIDLNQRGFFERVVSEASYEKVQDVSYRIKGVWQVILRYGAVRIQTAGASVELEIQNVKNPEKIQELIGDLAHLDKKNKNEAGEIDLAVSSPTSEEFKIIRKSIEDLDERQLEELENIVRNKLRQIKLKRLEEIREIKQE